MPTLKKGQTFTMDGTKWRVAYVNESRAHCVSTGQRPVTVTDRLTGEPRTFLAASSATMNISPNSELGYLKGVA